MIFWWRAPEWLKYYFLGKGSPQKDYNITFCRGGMIKVDYIGGRGPLKKWKYLKSGDREIQFQQVFDIAKIFPMCVFE